MKKTILIILIITTSYQLLAQFEDLTFGTDSTLDVVSWNIEHFPKNGQVTVDYVVQIIEALDADVVAIQEMSSLGAFQMLIDALDGWEGYFASNPYVSLVILYKTEVVNNPKFSIIYPDNDREFPREPLLCEMVFEEETYIIINNHLKCCGDGYLDNNDDWDEEKRRLDACNLLDEFIDENHPDDRVIVLGDMNDILTDSQANNVFQIFTDDPDNYLFADMEIAEGSEENWSYPSWPSHIDHILMTNELFEDFENTGSEIQTIKLDEYMDGGWNEYDNNISDHRPVGLKIKPSSSLGLNDFLVSKSNLSNFPNPFNAETTITFDPVPAKAKIEILDMEGQKIQHFTLNNGQASVIWNAGRFPAGVYYVKLIINDQVIELRKMVLLP